MTQRPELRPRKGDLRRSAWRWLASLAILAAVLNAFPAHGILVALRGVSAPFFTGALLLALVTHAGQAARLHMLARSAGFVRSYPEILRIHFLCVTIGLLLPGGNLAAMAVRAHRIGADGGGLLSASAILLMDRLLAATTLAVAGLCCMALMPAGGLGPVGLALAGLALAGALVIATALRGPARLPEPLRRRLPEVRIPREALLRAALVSLLLHAAGIATFVLLARALGLSPGWLEIGYARSAMLAATLLPVTVAGLGVREAAAALVLGGLGAPPEAAVAFSLLSFAVTGLIPAVIGALIPAAGRMFLRGRD